MESVSHIWIHRNGQRFGPMSIGDAILSIQRERFQLSDLGWHDGMPQWAPLGEIEAIKAELAKHMTMARPLPKF